MKSKYKIHLAFIILIVGYIAITFFKSDISKVVHSDKNKIWVQIDLVKILPRDTTDYFYYGQINEDLLEQIEQNKDEGGLFLLKNIRYWDNDDKLRVYDDTDEVGIKMFRVNDISYVNVLKEDPIMIYDSTELHRSAIRLRYYNNRLVN
nr:hypothetical protein [uncultured Carboxylicivirga sp.]